LKKKKKKCSEKIRTKIIQMNPERTSATTNNSGTPSLQGYNYGGASTTNQQQVSLRPPLQKSWASISNYTKSVMNESWLYGKPEKFYSI
jgi:hypothetical protein